MYTPGYEEENKTKPKITLKIEETDAGATPDQAASALFQGMYSGFLVIRGFNEPLALPRAGSTFDPSYIALTFSGIIPLIIISLNRVLDCN